MKIISILSTLSMTVASLSGCGARDMVRHVFADDDDAGHAGTDQSAQYRGFVGSTDEFALAPDDRRSYLIVGALKDGDLALLRIPTRAASRRLAEIIAYGRYRVVDGELKLVNEFGCTTGPQRPRDYYFDVSGDSGDFILHETSSSKLLTPPVELRVRRAWNLVTNDQTDPITRDEIGCAAPDRDTAAEPYRDAIASLLSP